MEFRIKWAIFSAFAALLFFSSCSEQPTQLVPVAFTGTQLPSKTPTKTPRPTKTLYPTWTPRVTATATAIFPDPCAKNPVPTGLLVSQSSIENNKLIVFRSEFRDAIPWGRADIYTVAFDGSNLKRLTYYSGDDKWPRWSSDGKKIFFYSDRSHQVSFEGEPGYFVMNVDGTDARRVTPDSPYYPYRSPDGKYIAYTIDFYDELRLEHGLGDYLSNVFVENTSGSYKRNITAEFQPAAFGRIDWSPDGKHFAFTGVTEPMIGEYWPVRVYLANADGSNLRRLDEGGAYRDDNYGYQEKAWSSDGKRLAFLTAKGIAVINADGSGFSEYKLKNNAYARDVFWSDDNQYLIFTDNTDTLYQISPDFTYLGKLPLITDLDKLLYRMQLLKTRGLRDQKQRYYYELSPNGKRLAYLEYGIYPNNTCRQIRVMSVETAERYFVLDQEKLIPYLLDHSPNVELSIISSDSIYNSSWFGNLLWSSDSEQLLFTHSYDGLNAFQHQDLFVINLDGTGLRLIMDDVWDPAIQP